MNERIRELAEQAGSTHKQSLGVYQFYEHELKEFAKLLVEQTINEMTAQMFYYGIDEANNPSFYKAIDKTKQHFGVEA
jgi:hypothetical protein